MCTCSGYHSHWSYNRRGNVSVIGLHQFILNIGAASHHWWCGWGKGDAGFCSRNGHRAPFPSISSPVYMFPISTDHMSLLLFDALFVSSLCHFTHFLIAPLGCTHPSLAKVCPTPTSLQLSNPFSHPALSLRKGPSLKSNLSISPHRFCLAR